MQLAGALTPSSSPQHAAATCAAGLVGSSAATMVTPAMTSWGGPGEASQQQQQWFGGTGLELPLQMPGAGQQATMLVGESSGCGSPQGGMMAMAYGGPAQQRAVASSDLTPVGSVTPVSFFGPSPTATTAPATPQLPKACSTTSCLSQFSQEDLIATVMPEASLLDREQLAEQLRAAAPCCYED